MSKLVHRPALVRLLSRVAVGAVLLAGLGAADCEGDGEMAIYDVEPRQGEMSAQQPVKITGTGFRHDVGYRIYFGNVRAEKVTLLDESTMVTVAPRQDDPGAVDITVLADSGEAFRVRDVFTYAEGGAAPAGGGDEPKGNLAY